MQTHWFPLVASGTSKDVQRNAGQGSVVSRVLDSQLEGARFDPLASPLSLPGGILEQEPCLLCNDLYLKSIALDKSLFFLASTQNGLFEIQNGLQMPGVCLCLGLTPD